jgi:valyl-tRNA synthetase
VMDIVLSASLRLLHPFMPHITEELWALLAFGEGSIQFATEPAPVATTGDTSGKRKLARDIYETVQAGRNLRAEARVPSNKKVPFILRSAGENLDAELPTLARLLNAETVVLDPTYQPQSGMSVAVTPLGEIILATTITDKSAERERLQKEIERIQTELKTVRAKLNNASFVDRAPAAVVAEHRERERNFGEQLVKLKQALKALD